MPIKRRLCPDVSHSSRRIAQNSLWITDDVLDHAFHRFLRYSRGTKRYGSNVPGPLEAQRRLARRRMMGLASVASAPAIDPAALFGIGGPELGKVVWQAPKEVSAPHKQLAQLDSPVKAPVSWLDKLGLSKCSQPTKPQPELLEAEQTEDALSTLIRIHYSTATHASWLQLRKRLARTPVAELPALASKAEEMGFSRERFCKDAFRSVVWSKKASQHVLEFMINSELNDPEARNLTWLVSDLSHRPGMINSPEALNKVVHDCLKLGLVSDEETGELIEAAFGKPTVDPPIVSKSGLSTVHAEITESLIDAIWSGLRACPIRSKATLSRAANLILDLLPPKADLPEERTKQPALLFELYKHLYPLKYSQTDHLSVGVILADWAIQACNPESVSGMNRGTLTDVLGNLHSTIISERNLIMATKLLMRKYDTGNIDRVHDIDTVLISWLTCLQKALPYRIWSPVLGLMAQKAVSPLDLADIFSRMGPDHHLTCEALLTHWIPRLPAYRKSSHALKANSLHYDDSLQIQQYAGETSVVDINKELAEYRVLHQCAKSPHGYDSFAFLLMVLFRHSRGSTLFNQQLILSLAERLLGTSALAEICSHARSAGVYIHPQPVAEVVRRIAVEQPRVALLLWKSRKLNIPDMRAFLCSMIADGVPSLEIFRVLSFPNPRHYLLPGQRQHEQNALTHERIELVHHCADAFSRQQTSSLRVAFRNVHFCYLHLKARHAPIGPLMSRALVRAGIINYLQANVNVSVVQMKWIIKVVEEIEGQEIAHELDELTSRWLNRVYARRTEENWPLRSHTPRPRYRFVRRRNGLLKGQQSLAWLRERGIIPGTLRRYFDDGSYTYITFDGALGRTKTVQLHDREEAPRAEWGDEHLEATKARNVSWQPAHCEEPPPAEWGPEDLEATEATNASLQPEHSKESPHAEWGNEYLEGAMARNAS